MMRLALRFCLLFAVLIAGFPVSAQTDADTRNFKLLMETIGKAKAATNADRKVALLQKALEIERKFTGWPDLGVSRHELIGEVQLDLAEAFMAGTGDKGAQIERAIPLLEKASGAIAKRDEFLDIWGRLHTTLGNAFRDRKTGNVSQNLDRAVSEYQLALGAFDPSKNSEAYAIVQTNLGSAYTMKGILTQDVAQFSAANQAFRSAIAVVDPNTNPELHGRIQSLMDATNGFMPAQ